MTIQRNVGMYIMDQEEKLSMIYAILNDIILEHDSEIKSSLSYGIPFYKIPNNKSVCYLTTFNKKSVDITFWNGINILHQFPELEIRNRKRMASLNYSEPEEINIPLIKNVLDATLKQIRK